MPEKIKEENTEPNYDWEGRQVLLSNGVFGSAESSFLQHFYFDVTTRFGWVRTQMNCYGSLKFVN